MTVNRERDSCYNRVQKTVPCRLTINGMTPLITVGQWSQKSLRRRRCSFNRAAFRTFNARTVRALSLAKRSDSKSSTTEAALRKRPVMGLRGPQDFATARPRDPITFPRNGRQSIECDMHSMANSAFQKLF